MTRCLDLRSGDGNLARSKAAAFHTKREAEVFAAARGWRLSDVTPAANRFWQFWVVGQCLTVDTFRLLTQDGHVDVPFPGWV